MNKRSDSNGVQQKEIGKTQTHSLCSRRNGASLGPARCVRPEVSEIKREARFVSVCNLRRLGDFVLFVEVAQQLQPGSDIVDGSRRQTRLTCTSALAANNIWVAPPEASEPAATAPVLPSGQLPGLPKEAEI
jgi:hypothetical protein